VSSIYSGLQIPSTLDDQNDDQLDNFDRQSSTGSLLSLMSAQSALHLMAAPPSMSIISTASGKDYIPKKLKRIKEILSKFYRNLDIFLGFFRIYFKKN
jgi:hypothetical protein